MKLTCFFSNIKANGEFLHEEGMNLPLQGEEVQDEGDDLDRRAFGFAVGDIVTLMPDQIGIQYPGDLENPEDAIERMGDPVAWAKSVSLREPIDVTYRQGRFWVEDGHHRWTAARILKKRLRCRAVKIDDNPLLALQARGLAE